MNFYEELNNVQIVYAHKTLAKLFMYGVFNKPKRTELPYISEKDLDHILNKVLKTTLFDGRLATVIDGSPTLPNKIA